MSLLKTMMKLQTPLSIVLRKPNHKPNLGYTEKQNQRFETLADNKDETEIEKSRNLVELAEAVKEKIQKDVQFNCPESGHPNSL